MIFLRKKINSMTSIKWDKLKEKKLCIKRFNFERGLCAVIAKDSKNKDFKPNMELGQVAPLSTQTRY